MLFWLGVLAFCATILLMSLVDDMRRAKEIIDEAPSILDGEIYDRKDGQR